MNDLLYWIILAIISTSVMPSWAATVIERSGFREDKQLVILDKHQARIGSANCDLRILRDLKKKRETADCDIYTLLDLQKKKAYLVNHQEETVVTMDIEGKPMKLRENLPSMRQQLQQSSKKDKPITAKLVKRDKSPFIAGYPTVVYQVTANGKMCSKIYFSKKAANIQFLKDFLEAMRKLSSSRQPPRPKGMPIHPCRQAHDELEAEFSQLGIPMKMVIKKRKGTKEKEGKRKNKIIFHKISKIKKNIKISPTILALPKGYKVMTEQEMQAQQQAKFEQWQQAQQQRGKRYSQQRDRQRGDYDMPVRGREGERQGEGGYYPSPPPKRWREDDRQSDGGYYQSPRARIQEGERGAEGYYPPLQERWREDDRRGEGYYPPPPGRWRESEKQGDGGYYQSPRARIQEGEREAEGYYPPPPGRWRENERRGEDGYPPDGWSEERNPYYITPPRYRDDRSGYDNDY